LLSIPPVHSASGRLLPSADPSCSRGKSLCLMLKSGAFSSLSWLNSPFWALENLTRKEPVSREMEYYGVGFLWISDSPAN
jgi:hypothetical protein